MQKSTQAYVLASGVLAAIIAHGFILYFVDAPLVRLTTGWLTLTPIVWGGARLGVVEHTLSLVNPARYPRRFMRLRSRVEELLGEIRRLNGIAVDARRGVREKVEAVQMMDTIEARLKVLITEIRATAGVVEPRPSPFKDDWTNLGPSEAGAPA